MAKYKAYPEYKDSGVEWLGGVPKHWSAKSLKFLAHSMIRLFLNQQDMITKLNMLILEV